MQRSKMLLGLFIVVAIVQVAVPAGIIWRYEYTLRTGEAYRFRTAPVDPYDAFRGRYVALRFASVTVPLQAAQPVTYGQEVYAILEYGADGFAQFAKATTVLPEHQDYLLLEVQGQDTTQKTVTVTLPFDRFYMEETIAPQAEQVYREHTRRGQQDASVIVRVRDGRGVIENVYIGDTPLADVVRQQPSAP